MNGANVIESDVPVCTSPLADMLHDLKQVPSPLSGPGSSSPGYLKILILNVSRRCRDLASLPSTFCVHGWVIRKTDSQTALHGKQRGKQHGKQRLDFFTLKALCTSRNIIKIILASGSELQFGSRNSLSPREHPVCDSVGLGRGKSGGGSGPPH